MRIDKKYVITTIVLLAVVISGISAIFVVQNSSGYTGEGWGPGSDVIDPDEECLMKITGGATYISYSDTYIKWLKLREVSGGFEFYGKTSEPGTYYGYAEITRPYTPPNILKCPFIVVVRDHLVFNSGPDVIDVMSKDSLSEFYPTNLASNYTLTTEASWLKLENGRLTGTVPTVQKQTVVEATITAAAVEGTQVKTKDITINIAPSFSINVSSGEGGSVNKNGTVAKYRGESETLTFTPQTGYKVSKVLIDGKNDADAVALGKYTFSNIQGNHTVAVAFEKKKYNVTATSDENGKMESTSESMEYNGNKKFTFQPNTGYQIKELAVWKNNVLSMISLSPGTTEYWFTNITSDIKAHAVFEKKSYQITVNRPDNVSVYSGGNEINGLISVLFKETIKLDFTTDEMYAINSVKVGSVQKGPVNSITLENISANQTIVISTEKRSYRIDLKIEGSGTVSGKVSDSQYVVNHGDDLQFLMIPEEGYRIGRVLVDGTTNIDAAALGKYLFSNIRDAHEIEVLFEKKKYNVTATSDGNGKVESDTSNVVEHDGSKKFVFKPNEGYQIKEIAIWKDNLLSLVQLSSGTTEYLFTNITSDIKMDAVFEKKSYQITVNRPDHVSVYLGGNEIDGTIMTLFNETIELNFIANEKYTISGVKVGSVQKGSVQSVILLNVSADQTVEVQTEMRSYRIDLKIEGSGTVSENVNDSHYVVDHGDDLELSMVPDEGYRISKILVDGIADNDAVTLGKYLFSSIQGAHAIEVIFEKKKYNVTATSDGNGKVESETSDVVEHGGSKKFTFKPDPGYQIKELIVSNGEFSIVTMSPDDADHWFMDITYDMAVRAVFEKCSYMISIDRSDNVSVYNAEGQEIGRTVNVLFGDSFELFFVADKGYEIESIKVDKDTGGAATSYLFENVSAGHTLEIVSKKISYGVEVKTEGNGTVSGVTGDRVIQVSYGDDVELSFIPGSGYLVKDVIVDGISKGSQNSMILSNVESGHVVEVVFGIREYSLSGSIDGEGVIYADGEELITRSLNSGMDVSLTFEAEDGYWLRSVIVNGTDLGPIPTYKILNIGADHTITTVFEKEANTISVSTSGNGKVLDQNGNDVTIMNVPFEWDVCLFFEPESGYEVREVTVDGVKKGTMGSYAFLNISADHEIHVSFEPRNHSIWVTGNDGGMVSSNGELSVEYGSDHTVYFTPHDGFRISRVMINDVEDKKAASDGSYTFSSIENNQSVVVSFEKIPKDWTIEQCIAIGACILGLVCLLFEVRHYMKSNRPSKKKN